MLTDTAFLSRISQFLAKNFIMERKFKTGDIVRELGKNQEMKVKHYHKRVVTQKSGNQPQPFTSTETQLVVCVWQEAGEHRRGMFHEDDLILID